MSQRLEIGQLKIYSVIFIVLIALNRSFAQNAEIVINNCDNEKIYVSALNGEKVTVVDSIASSVKGVFRFRMDKEKYHPGIYRITFEPNKWINIINDGEELSIITHYQSILDSLTVKKSESNKLFYSFLRLNKQYKNKSELLFLVLSRYPKEDSFYRQAQSRLNELQYDYLKFVQITSQTNESSFVAKYIKSSQLQVIDPALPIDKQLTFLKAHALDKVDFNNSVLINSDLYANKTIEYLTYYRNPQLPLELLEKEFMIAVDSLFSRARVNQLVYQHITEYLIDGFKKFGFENVLDYIVENYVIKDDLCLDDKTEGLIKRRIDQARNLKIGNMAPNITLPDKNGIPVTLKYLKAEKRLLVFYASWCPHCKELLPKLNQIFKEQNVKKFEILAISLDSKKEDWLEFTRNNCPDLTNVSDLKGWDSSVATEYFIYATPTLFLLDRENKIIGKPMTIKETEKLLSSGD